MRTTKLAPIVPILALLALASPLSQPMAQAEPQAQRPTMYSIWLIESSRFRDVPAGAFMPDRAFVPGSPKPSNNQPFFQLPVNITIAKGGSDLVMYDVGWKQQQYLRMTDSVAWAPIRDQMAVIGLRPEDVTKIVVGHGHWDHAGQLDEFPNATLYIQGEELRGIEWALNYPNPAISAVNTSPGGCNRTPACGYPPDTLDQIYGMVLNNRAVIVEGQMEIASGLTIHPAHRAHTAGSQLLQIHTVMGEFVTGSDAYSSWEAIRDWMAANIQQTDTVQQFLAYEKCYRIAGDVNRCIAAHEPLTYTSGYPITQNSWVGPNGSRGAELVLAPGEASRRPGAVAPARAPAQVPR